MTNEYEGARTGAESSADGIVAQFHAIDKKVNAMREQRMSDPDSLLDKLFKFAVPAIAGMVAGHVFQFLWNKGTSHTHNGSADKSAGGSAHSARFTTQPTAQSHDAQQGLLMSLLFAASSAAFGAVVTQLSDRGSKAFVEHRHRRAARKK